MIPTSRQSELSLILAALLCLAQTVATQTLPGDCGKVPQAKHDRISGGFYPADGAVPSYVSVLSVKRFKNGTEEIISCGGVILSERLIMTAAHCVTRSIVKTAVYLRPTKSYDELRTKDEGMNVSLTCLPKHYLRLAPSKIDLAVLRLDRPINFDKYTQPACLPSQPLAENLSAYNIGLGLTESGQQAIKLKALRTRRIKCSAMLAHETALCTMYENPKVPGMSCKGKFMAEKRENLAADAEAAFFFSFKMIQKLIVLLFPMHRFARGFNSLGDSGGPLIGYSQGKQTVFGVSSLSSENCTTTNLNSSGLYIDMYAARDLVQQLLYECSE